MTDSDAGTAVGEEILRTVAREYGLDSVVQVTNSGSLDDVMPAAAASRSGSGR